MITIGWLATLRNPSGCAPSFSLGSLNSGHTATLRSAKIAKATSYVRRTLGEIVDEKHIRGGVLCYLGLT